MDAAAKLIDPMVPDLATETVVRRKRAPKHDFKDGNGRVFAHRHDNGGGWVADTAYVAPGAKVTRNAQVFGYARVHDECEITGRSIVYGRARLFDAVRMEQDAAVGENALVRHTAILRDNARVAGFANVLGNTRMSGWSAADGNAVVMNSNVSGPKRPGLSLISGNARVFNCRCWGFIRIRDTALLENSQLNNVFVYETARIVSSSAHSALPWVYMQYMEKRVEETELPRPFEESVMWLGGVMLNANLQTPHWVMSGALQLINAVLITGSSGDPNDNFCQSTLGSLRGPVVSVDERGQDNIRALVQRLSNPAAQYIPAAAPARAAIDVNAVHQRRIMRMEGT